MSDKSGYPEMAWVYIEKLRSKCQALQTAPFRGQKRDDLRENPRIISIEKMAVAAFEVNEDKHSVTILNIFYGGRDYETLMRERGESKQQ